LEHRSVGVTIVASTTLSITYSECVSVAIVIQHAERLRHIVTCPSLQYFSTLSHNGTIFLEKVTEHKMCVLIFSTILSETFLILRRIQRDITTNVHRSSREVPVVLAIY